MKAQICIGGQKTQGRAVSARSQARQKPHACPRSASVKSCSDNCRRCRRFTKDGHDQRGVVFRDYLPETERRNPWI